jgi:hypothetical protein
MASASVFASGVDHCRSESEDVGADVEDHWEVRFAVRLEICRGADRLHCAAVRSRFRDLVLMSVCVIEVP